MSPLDSQSMLPNPAANLAENTGPSSVQIVKAMALQHLHCRVPVSIYQQQVTAKLSPLSQKSFETRMRCLLCLWVEAKVFEICGIAAGASVGAGKIVGVLVSVRAGTLVNVFIGSSLSGCQVKRLGSL